MAERSEFDEMEKVVPDAVSAPPQYKLCTFAVMVADVDALKVKRELLPPPLPWM